MRPRWGINQQFVFCSRWGEILRETTGTKEEITTTMTIPLGRSRKDCVMIHYKTVSAKLNSACFVKLGEDTQSATLEEGGQRVSDLVFKELGLSTDPESQKEERTSDERESDLIFKELGELPIPDEFATPAKDLLWGSRSYKYEAISFKSLRNNVISAVSLNPIDRVLEQQFNTFRVENNVPIHGSISHKTGIYIRSMLLYGKAEGLNNFINLNNFPEWVRAVSRQDANSWFGEQPLKTEDIPVFTRIDQQKVLEKERLMARIFNKSPVIVDVGNSDSDWGSSLPDDFDDGHQRQDSPADFDDGYQRQDSPVDFDDGHQRQDLPANFDETSSDGSLGHATAKERRVGRQSIRAAESDRPV